MVKISNLFWRAPKSLHMATAAMKVKDESEKVGLKLSKFKI